MNKTNYYIILQNRDQIKKQYDETFFTKLYNCIYYQDKA